MNVQIKMTNSNRLSFLLLVSALLLNPAPAFAADVEVSVEGLKSSKGQLILYLFAEKDSAQFPTALSSAHCITKADAAIEAVLLNCKDLPEGQYAALVFHDTNNNGTLDHSLLGKPKEPLGFSAGCVPKFPPPKFNDCDFTVSGTLTNESIEI